MGKRSALLELVGLGLELCGLLQTGINIFVCPMATTSLRSSDGKAYLGNLEKALGDVDNPGHLLDVLNAGLYGLGVVGTSRVQDVLDLLVLAIGPLLVHGGAELDERAPDGEQADGDDGLLVDDVVLVADGVDGETGGGREDGRLGEQAAAGERVDQALGLGLGVLLGGGVGGAAARRDEGRDGGQGAGSNARSEAGGP